MIDLENFDTMLITMFLGKNNLNGSNTINVSPKFVLIRVEMSKITYAPQAKFLLTASFLDIFPSLKQLGKVTKNTSNLLANF